MTRLLLLGSGENNGSDLLNTLFAHLMRNGQLLYLPIAQYPQNQTYMQSYKTMQGVFHQLGIKAITMWDSITQKTPEDMDDFHGAYIGGGNTFKLLHDMRQARFDVAIRHFLAHDGIIYGASAGAIVLGKSIRTAAHLDRNNIHEQNMNALNILHGYSVWPHYHYTEDKAIYAYSEHYKEPVIAISERTGLFVDDTLAIVIGHEPIYIFTPHAKHTYPPSSVVSF